jgi:microcystin-dependent protein
MMARTAEWRDDISGTITTAGTSTVYTVASNQGFDSLADMNGAMIAFVPHTTNGATVTLNVDGLGNVPLRTAPAVELPSGVMPQGTPFVATYNNSDGAFYLQGFAINPYSIPIGGLMPYLGASAPNSSFALPSGQTISRVTYSVLFALVSTTFGNGDGSTTFGLPDLRGRAIFGKDNMGGSAAGRISVAGGNFDGTVLGGTGGAQNQTLTQAQLPAVAPAFNPSGQLFLTLGGGTATGFANGTGAIDANQSAISGSIGNLGSGNSHPILSPAMTLPYILRII